MVVCLQTMVQSNELTASQSTSLECLCRLSYNFYSLGSYMGYCAVVLLPSDRIHVLVAVGHDGLQ